MKQKTKNIFLGLLEKCDTTYIYFIGYFKYLHVALLISSDNSFILLNTLILPYSHKVLKTLLPLNSFTNIKLDRLHFDQLVRRNRRVILVFRQSTGHLPPRVAEGSHWILKAITASNGNNFPLSIRVTFAVCHSLISPNFPTWNPSLFS